MKSDPPFASLGIVGLGLIGGSIAKAAREIWPAVRISGVDRDSVARAARDAGLIDEAADGVPALRPAELVILATPVEAILQQVGEAARAGLGGVVTDVGSTKRAIVAAATTAGLKHFVGGHPIAGSERGGLEGARQDLFAGRPWLLMDEAGTAGRDATRERLERFVRGLGARPIWIDAVTHDRWMAYVSHLPQWIATNLMSVAGAGVGEAGLAVAGRGFADMTRLAASPADVWQSILATNADFVAEAVDALRSALASSPAEFGDGDRTSERFAEARRWRSAIVSQPESPR